MAHGPQTDHADLKTMCCPQRVSLTNAEYTIEDIESFKCLAYFTENSKAALGMKVVRVHNIASHNALTTHLHLVTKSRMRGTITPLPQYAFVAWC
jgi:hypothetical protein